MENIIIRNETEADRRTVENLVRESFWNVYRPGCMEHFVLHRLRDDPAFVPELDLVMEKDGKIIGQNMFMRAVIKADDGRDIPIMAMGPICIAPELKLLSAAARCALKEISAFTARAASRMQAGSEYDTTACPKAPTRHSSSAGS